MQSQPFIYLHNGHATPQNSTWFGDMLPCQSKSWVEGLLEIRFSFKVKRIELPYTASTAGPGFISYK